MFSKGHLKSSESVNILGKGAVVSGDIHIQGDFRLDGILDGNLKVNGRLVVGPEGKITGNIQSDFADISGEVKGDVKIKQTLHLLSTCVIEGDVECDKLVVDGGAKFNGNCRMGAKLKTLQESLVEGNKLHEAR